MAEAAATALAVAGMAAVTYATRAAGLFLVNRLRLTGRWEPFLQSIPGTVLISILAPAVLAGGPAEWLAAAATAAASLRFRSLPLALAAGLATVWILRHIM